MVAVSSNTPSPEFLLIGGDSEIAAATSVHLRSSGIEAVATTRKPGRLGEGRIFLDLAQPLDGWSPPDGIRAACIFAAVARLADCHNDPRGSSLINVTRAIELAECLTAGRIYVLFLSTNQVFDGSRPMVRADEPRRPISEYGRQKARTEMRLEEMAEQGARVGVLRLSKIVSPGMPLLRRWEAELSAGRAVEAFGDMALAPVPVATVAATIATLMRARAPGVWQLTGPRDVSYAETADYIAKRVGADSGLVRPVSATSAGMPEGSTPRHTTLDSSALRERFGIAAADAWTTIAEVLDG
jgi:dTDP-4-dehydrorhamnose reductase